MKKVIGKGTKLFVLFLLLVANISIQSSDVWAEPSLSPSHQVTSRPKLLHFFDITVSKTEELEDEPYLLVDGRKVWRGTMETYPLCGGNPVRCGISVDRVSLEYLTPIPFYDSIKIELKEEDWPDSDDNLGQTTIDATETDGQYSVNFTENDTDYELTYTISSDPAPAYANESDTLGPNEVLLTDQKITSLDGRFSLLVQSDGNLVLYQNSRGPLWASGTLGSGATHVIMQSDGNLVLYTTDNVPVWASGTMSGSSSLRVQNDGNLVIYADGIGAVWATDTAQ